MTRALIAALAISVGIVACGGPESPGNKREWSILQNLEYETRNDRASELQFRKVDEYVAMAVPREGDRRLVWVLLNPAHDPFYKQMPEGNYWLDPSQVRSLVADHPLTPTVEQALRSHIRQP